MQNKPMDRRSFMGRIVLSAGGGIAATALPASLLQAGEYMSGVAAACVATPRQPDSCGDWKLDDMCTAYPGYAYDVRRAPGLQDPRLTGVAAIDLLWVA